MIFEATECFFFMRFSLLSLRGDLHVRLAREPHRDHDDDRHDERDGRTEVPVAGGEELGFDDVADEDVLSAAEELGNEEARHRGEEDERDARNDAETEEPISIKTVEYDIKPETGNYTVTFATANDTSITVKVLVVAQNRVESKVYQEEIYAMNFFKKVEDIQESIALDTDLETWASASAWSLGDGEQVEITDVKYDFDPENITPGVYDVTFSTEGYEYKVSTTHAYEEGEQVGLVFRPEDIHVMKKDEELRTLREHGLGIVYIGLESGNEELLKKFCKGVTAEEIVVNTLRCKEAGIATSVTAINGMAGADGDWRAHAIDTAKAVSRMKPDYIAFLTLRVYSGTPLHDWIERGEFQMMNPTELMTETRLFLEHIDSEGSVFRSNHASNYLPLGGTLNRDREELIHTIDEALDGKVRLRRAVELGL
jgi:hypothetical protein